MAILPQPTSQDTIVMGRNVFLYINYGENATEANPVWTIVGGQRSTSVDLTADEIDASHKTSGGWKTSKAGLRGWKFSSEAVVLDGDMGAEGVEKAFIDGVPAQFKLVTKDDLGNTIKAEIGWGSVTSFSRSASYDDVETASMEISGNGALSVQQNTISPVTATFSKAAPVDKVFTLTLAGGATFSAVKNGNTTLTATTDYTYTNGTLTILDDYLAEQANGDVKLTVVTTDLNSPKITITVGA